MSHEKIRSISVRDDKVLVHYCSNNVWPRHYHKEEYSSLSAILKEDGRDALDLEILKAYQGGSFRGGKNRYTRALKVLEHMPEYLKLRGMPFDEYVSATRSQQFENLLKTALKTQLPKDRFIILKQFNGRYVYLRRRGTKTAEWIADRTKATVFRYKEDAETYKESFPNTAEWQIEALTGSAQNPSKLMTQEISRQAQEQYGFGADMQNQLVLAKFFDPCGSWTWYLMNQDPDDMDYLWGIVSGFEVEAGSFSLSELENHRGRFHGLGIERDLYFKPLPAIDVWRRLQDGEHI